MPQPSGGRLAGVPGSLPVSRQAGGWPALPATARMPPGGGAGTGRAAASSTWAHMDSTVWRWKECHSLTWCWSRPVWPLPCWWHSSAGPSLPGHRDQGRQRRRPAQRHMAVVEGQVRCVGEAAAGQQPVPRRGGGGPRPLVVPAALAARPARAGLPRRGRDHRGDGGHGRLAAGGKPDRKVHRDREHVPLAGLLAGRRSLALRPYTSSPATQQNGTHARAAAVIIAAASAGLVVNHAHRGAASFQLGGLIDRQNRLRVTQTADEEPLQRGQRRRPVPAVPGQQRPHPPRRGVPRLLRQLPARPAVPRLGQQRPDVRERRQPRPGLREHPRQQREQLPQQFPHPRPVTYDGPGGHLAVQMSHKP